MKWTASAPSNIALIKYMGKVQAPQKNVGTNKSLSYTLSHLRSYVELELTHQTDHWEPLAPYADLDLSTGSQQRFIDHLNFLKAQFDFQGSFKIRSGNNFPLACGLASSASSFAALTQCAVQALAELTAQPVPILVEQAHLSRQGSGSSCRSFFSPWVMWDQDIIEPINFPYAQLYHQVILIDSEVKKVSSSEAHQRVTSSALFAGRAQRAAERFDALCTACYAQNWAQMFDVIWDEFQDMHNLFATAHPPFQYFTVETLQVLHFLREFWKQNNDGPLVTMDAGPNIHLLYRPDQTVLAKQLESQLQPNFKLTTYG